MEVILGSAEAASNVSNIAVVIGIFASLVSILAVGIAAVWRLATINTKIETIKSDDIPFVKMELANIKLELKEQTTQLHEKANQNAERITRLEV